MLRYTLASLKSFVLRILRKFLFVNHSRCLSLHFQQCPCVRYHSDGMFLQNKDKVTPSDAVSRSSIQSQFWSAESPRFSRYINLTHNPQKDSSYYQSILFDSLHSFNLSINYPQLQNLSSSSTNAPTMHVLRSVIVLIASLLAAQASPNTPRYFDTRDVSTPCDVYACGWCHWYYKCLTNDNIGNWKEPW